jgi:transcriptional regulator with XRE-family HTH domain
MGKSPMYPNSLRGLIEMAGYSAKEVAKAAHISERTLHYWAAGDRIIPHEDRLVLARILECAVEDLAPHQKPQGMAELLEDSSQPQGPDAASGPPQTACLWLPPAPTLQDFIASNITRRIFQIAHTDYDTPDEITNTIRATIKEFDTMNMGDSTYKITRREAMYDLAVLPMMALGHHQTLPTRRYEEMLRYCTAALEACWELYRGSDSVGTRHAFDCVCTYVPLLETIAKDSAQYRREALDLATQYALLQTMLGWKCAKPMDCVSYAQNALSLSKETGNIFFQLSAYSKLNWTYLTSRQYTKAWETMQEGEYVLREYQRMKNKPPLPSGIIGNFYSSYSQAQVNSGVAPDTALGIATDSEPLQGRIAFVKFTTIDQWWEAASTCCSKGDPVQAMIWLGKLIDPERLTPNQNAPQNGWGRIATVNTLTRTLLQSPERDMNHIIHVWTVGMQGAQALRSEIRYGEAITNFEIMRVLWPSEQAIMKLLPLTAHWSEKKEHEP